MSSAALKCVSELWSQGDGKDRWPIVIGLLLVGNQSKHQHAYAIENWKPNAGLLAPVRQCMYVLYIRCLPWQRHTPWLVLTDNNTDREGQVEKEFSNFGINSLSLTGFQQLIGAHLPGQRDRSLEDSSPFSKKIPSKASKGPARMTGAKSTPPPFFYKKNCICMHHWPRSVSIKIR